MHGFFFICPYKLEGFMVLALNSGDFCPFGIDDDSTTNMVGSFDVPDSAVTCVFVNFFFAIYSTHFIAFLSRFSFILLKIISFRRMF